MAKYQFTLRTMLTVLTLTAVVLGLSTPSDPPTDEQRIYSQGHCFGPRGLFETLCLACILVPPYIAYGIRRRWRFSFLAIVVLAMLLIPMFYIVRYELGWMGVENLLRYCSYNSLFPLGCLAGSVFGTCLVCWLSGATKTSAGNLPPLRSSPAGSTSGSPVE